MSEENVEIVRAFFDAINRGDLFASAGDVEAFVETFDPEGEVVDPPDVPGATTHHGHDSIRRYLRSFAKFWTGWRMEVAEVTAVGHDRVFANGRALGRGRASGVEVVRPFHLVATVRNERLMQVRYYGSRHDALEAAGLSE